MRNRNAGVAFILIVLILDTLGIGVVVPVLPKLVTQLSRGDLAAGSRYYGFFVAAYALMQVLFAPMLGALSDRYGRRPVILASLLGAALDYALLALAPDLWWLFLGRVLAGVTGASFSAATAYIADVTPPAKRAQSFGLVGVAFGVGFIIGPAIGGLAGSYNLRAPFVLAACLNLANFLYGVFVLPESLSRENRRPVSFARANPFGALVNLGRSPVLLGLTGTMLCGYLAQQILQSSWALYTGERFGWSPRDVGMSLAFVGVIAALVQGGLVRVIVPKLGERRSLLFALVFSVAGHTAFALSTRGWMMYVFIVPFALGGLAGPAVQAILSREVTASEQGELQGSLTSLSSLSAVVAPLLATSLFARFAPATATPRIPGAPFFAAAVINLVGLGLAARLFARLPAAKAAEAPEVKAAADGVAAPGLAADTTETPGA